MGPFSLHFCFLLVLFVPILLLFTGRLQNETRVENIGGFASSLPSRTKSTESEEPNFFKYAGLFNAYFDMSRIEAQVRQETNALMKKCVRDASIESVGASVEAILPSLEEYREALIEGYGNLYEVYVALPESIEKEDTLKLLYRVPRFIRILNFLIETRINDCGWYE
jgi:hypothetical protein